MPTQLHENKSTLPDMNNSFPLLRTKLLFFFHSELIRHFFPTVQHSSVIGSNLTQLVSKLCCFWKQMIEEIWRRWTNAPATSKCIFLDIHFTFANCQRTVRGEQRDRHTPAGVLPLYGWQTVCLFLWQLGAPHRRLYSDDPLSLSHPTSAPERGIDP